MEAVRFIRAIKAWVVNIHIKIMDNSQVVKDFLVG
jgi:hypothetical protein